MDVAVCSSSDLNFESMIPVQAGRFALVVFRDKAGVVSALLDRCSHADVKLSRGTFDGCEVECPAHGARFDTKSGKNTCMPAVVPVKSFPAREEKGTIIVTVPD